METPKRKRARKSEKVVELTLDHMLRGKPIQHYDPEQDGPLVFNSTRKQIENPPKLKNPNISFALEEIWGLVMVFIRHSKRSPKFMVYPNETKQEILNRRLRIARTLLGRWLEYVVRLVKTSMLTSLEDIRKKTSRIKPDLYITGINIDFADKLYYQFSTREKKTYKQVHEIHMAFKQQYTGLMSNQVVASDILNVHSKLYGIWAAAFPEQAQAMTREDFQ
ncbi:hypothetical protein O5D80_005629 [Batrachochytrium dendrobatidis]|nr:hypothetical protein O5D80_005629 [Batrachochytrium dendrobatidis]